MGKKGKKSKTSASPNVLEKTSENSVNKGKDQKKTQRKKRQESSGDQKSRDAYLSRPTCVYICSLLVAVLSVLLFFIFQETLSTNIHSKPHFRVVLDDDTSTNKLISPSIEEKSFEAKNEHFDVKNTINRQVNEERTPEKKLQIFDQYKTIDSENSKSGSDEEIITEKAILIPNDEDANTEKYSIEKDGIREVGSKMEEIRHTLHPSGEKENSIIEKFKPTQHELATKEISQKSLLIGNSHNKKELTVNLKKTTDHHAANSLSSSYQKETEQIEQSKNDAKIEDQHGGILANISEDAPVSAQGDTKKQDTVMKSIKIPVSLSKIENSDEHTEYADIDITEPSAAYDGRLDKTETPLQKPEYVATDDYNKEENANYKGNDNVEKQKIYETLDNDGKTIGDRDKNLIDKSDSKTDVTVSDDKEHVNYKQAGGFEKQKEYWKTHIDPKIDEGHKKELLESIYSMNDVTDGEEEKDNNENDDDFDEQKEHEETQIDTKVNDDYDKNLPQGMVNIPNIHDKKEKNNCKEQVELYEQNKLEETHVNANKEGDHGKNLVNSKTGVADDHEQEEDEEFESSLDYSHVIDLSDRMPDVKNRHGEENENEHHEQTKTGAVDSHDENILREDPNDEYLDSQMEKTKPYHVEETFVKKEELDTAQGYEEVSTGVTKKILKKGTGPNIEAGDAITIDCIGYLDQNPPKKFWSTKDSAQKPFTFIVGKRQVIKGWDEGARSMRLHERSKVRIDSSKAYGKFGFEAWGIPPNTRIIMEMEVIEHKRTKNR